MLEEITTGQFYEWLAFYSLEPWGTSALDCLLAHFKALFCNSYLPKGKRPFKSERFMLYTDKQDASALYDVESGEEPEDEGDADHNRPGEDF